MGASTDAPTGDGSATGDDSTGMVSTDTGPAGTDSTGTDSTGDDTTDGTTGGSWDQDYPSCLDMPPDDCGGDNCCATASGTWIVSLSASCGVIPHDQRPVARCTSTPDGRSSESPPLD